MTITSNMFAMKTTQGDLDLQYRGSVITCEVSASQATALVAGQAVKMEDSAGGLPKVLALAANTESSFGFVVRNLKDQSFAAKAAVEIAMQGSVMFMTASAAIARGAKLEVIYTTNKVKTNAGTNPVMGFAIDKAAGDGDLIRVYVLSPSYESSQVIADIAGLQTALDVLTAAAAASVQNVSVTVTQAELNAGKTVIAGVTGKTITVIGMQCVTSGTYADGTATLIQSTNDTPVVVETLALAGMGAGYLNLLDAGDTNQTMGAGAGVPLGSGDGLKVIKSGSDFTGGTSQIFNITYKQA